MKKIAAAAAVWCALLISSGWCASISELFTEKRLMVIVTDAGNAGDFVGYAESFLKKRLKDGGGQIINPELITEVKKNQLLQEAIKNSNATQLARIATDFGADILINCRLSVDVRQKFATAWEGTASMNLVAISTATAEEMVNIFSDPLGTTANPAPIEDSPLMAKQNAVVQVCDNILVKAGILRGAADISGATTIRLSFFDVFDPGAQISAIAFSNNDRRLFVAAGDTVQAISLLEKNMTRLPADGRVTAITGLDDNRQLAAADGSGRFYVWNDPASSSPARKTTTPTRDISALAFHPGINMLALTGRDGKVYLYDLLSEQEPSVLKGHRDGVLALAFEPGGRGLISAGGDLTVRWWDINTLKEKKAIKESADKLLVMTLSRDGELLALSSVDIVINMVRGTRRDIRRIKVRRTGTGEEVRVFEYEKKADITALAFHPNKRFLASGSQDGSLVIWDIQKGESVSFLEMDDGIINVAFSADGDWFSACTNRKANVWKLK